MRAHKSLHEAAYSYATMLGLTPELRLKTQIRNRSTQFLSSWPSSTGENQRNSFMNRPKFRKIANDGICSELPLLIS